VDTWPRLTQSFRNFLAAGMGGAAVLLEIYRNGLSRSPRLCEPVSQFLGMYKKHFCEVHAVAPPLAGVGSVGGTAGSHGAGRESEEPR